MLLHLPQKRYRTLEKILSAYPHFTQQLLLPLCTTSQAPNMHSSPFQILLLGVILRVKEKSFIALQLMLAFLPIHSTGHSYFCPNSCV